MSMAGWQGGEYPALMLKFVHRNGKYFLKTTYCMETEKIDKGSYIYNGKAIAEGQSPYYY